MKTILKFKRVKNIFVIILAITAMGYISCEKTKPPKPEPDYREKWVGDYDFTITRSYAPPYYPDTTYPYAGSITKSVSHSNKILVDWGDGTIGTLSGVTFTQKSELTVDTNGKLTYPEYGGHNHWYFYNPSYISGDTIRFGFCAGGLGSWTTWDVIGIKTKVTY